MKTINKIALSLAVASSIFFVGCHHDSDTAKVEVAKGTISEESLGLRKTDLYSERKDTSGDMTSYSKHYAGSGHKITRAFQDAPPMIPHDTEGMLPITIKNNQCTSCHMPDVAPSMGATALPVSHFTNFRAATAIAKDGRITKNGTAVDNTSSANMSNLSIKSTGSKLAGARFNCSQCHAPQSDATDAPANTFEAVFSDKDGASKSSWSGSRLTDGLDTLAD